MAASSASETILISDSSDDSNSEDKPNTKESDPMECPICLQKCIHPARLPCGHIFCFLCVKGVAYKNKRCAMCRRDIPLEFLDHPQLVNGIDELKKSLNSDEGYQWFYEGRNGWWQYDERTSQELEDAFKKQEKSCSILVAGFVYTIDFVEMLQLRKNDPSRQRRVKRDLASIPKKGVAGLRIDSNNTIVTSNVEERLLSTNSSGGDGDGGTGGGGDDGGGGNNLNSLIIRNNFISPIAVTDAAVRIVSNIIDSTLAHANLDETHDDRRTRIRNIFEGIERPTSISPTELLDNNLLDRFDESSSPSSLNNNHNNSSNNNYNSSNDRISSRNSLNDSGNLSFEILDQVEDLFELSSSSPASTTVLEQQSPHPNNRACIFAQTIDGFRNLTLRNVIDSSDSEDDNEHIIL